MSQQTWSKPAGCPPPRGSKDSSQLLTLMTGCCIRTMSWKKLNWLSKKFCVQSWQKKPWSEVVRFFTRVLDGALLRLASLRLKKITWIAVNIVVAMISVHSFASSPSPLSWSWGKIHTIFPRYYMDWQKELLNNPSKLPIITITISSQ